MSELRQKHKIPDGKLEVEEGRELPKLTKDKAQGKNYSDYVNGLKRRFEMEGLALEGTASKRQETTLADLVRESEKNEVKGLTLAQGSTVVNGKKFEIWFLKPKV
jgi:hypothetical protein